MRVLSGPNRGGKTLAGAVTDICAALGFDHFRPWRKYTLPTLVWAVALDRARLGRILRDKLKSLLPPDGYREYIQDGIFVFSKKYGKSEIHMMSCEAGPDRFKGAECDHIHLDEEPNPRGDEIFNECYARIGPDRPLDIVMTFTPDQGATWSYGRLYDEASEDYLRGADGEKIVDFFEFSLFDCDKEAGGHLTKKQIMERYNAYKPHERRARFFGKYSLVGANIYYDAEQIEKAMARAQQKPWRHGKIEINDLRQTRIVYGEHPEWLVYEERIPGERYIVGFDVSGGNRKDRSVAYAIAIGLKRKNPDGQIVAGDQKPRLACRFKTNRMDPARFAREVCYPILMHYNRAVAIPERNGQYGGALLQVLRDPPIQYDNWYSDARYDKQKMEWKGDLGFFTSDSTRGTILMAHELALREEWDIYTPSCLGELGTIVEKRNPETGKTRVEAAHGAFDDEAFACGLAGVAYLQDPPLPEIPVELSAEIYEGDFISHPDGTRLGLGSNRREVFLEEEYA